MNVVRYLLVLLGIAIALAGCGPENGSKPEVENASESEGGCLWHWNRAANEEVREEAASFAGSEAVLGREDASECALYVPKLFSEEGRWELLPNERGGYRWHRTQRDFDIEPSGKRSGVIAADGSFGPRLLGPTRYLANAPSPVDTTPRLRKDRPRQPLVVGKSLPAEERTYCGKHCDKYKRTRLVRTRAPWIAYEVRDGTATIVYDRNQCDGALDEIVVSGRTIIVYQYVAEDPAPDDRYGVGVCSLVGGQCGGLCRTVDVPMPGIREAKDLKRGGVPEAKPPCRPWPRCWDQPKL